MRENRVMSRKRAAQFDEGFPFVTHERCTELGGLRENPIALNGLGFLTRRSRVPVRAYAEPASVVRAPST